MLHVQELANRARRVSSALQIARVDRGRVGKLELDPLGDTRGPGSTTRTVDSPNSAVQLSSTDRASTSNWSWTSSTHPALIPKRAR